MAFLSSRRTSREALPLDTRGELVDTLFNTVGSFLAGVAGALIVPIAGFHLTHDPAFVACGVVLALLGAYRIAVFAGYRAAKTRGRTPDPRRWEALYGLGAVGFMTAVGVTAAMLFLSDGDQITRLYAVMIAIGCAGALAARNAARPLIVYGQVLGVCGPLAGVLAAQGQIWFWGLAAMIVLIMLSVKSTTRFLNAVIVSALLHRRRAEREGERLGTALDSMSHGLVMVEADGQISVLNDRMRAFFALDGELTGERFEVLAGRIARGAGMSEVSAELFVGAWSAQQRSGRSGVLTETLGERVFRFRFEPRACGGFVLVVEDVTDAARAAREIERMAHFDPVTGLPNRAHFHKLLQAALVRRRAAGGPLALLSLDLDHFKEVNDARGHVVGDELLQLVARRLCDHVRPGDVVSRFGGDEFQVLVQTHGDALEVEELARRLIEAVSASYPVGGGVAAIGASIGVALAPEEPATADDLLRWADMALYRAKAEGRGVCRLFTPEMDVAMQNKRELGELLRAALANDHLEVHYQPVIQVETGRIVACEALVRLRHPEKGVISPAEFIPVAEETGLIVQVGEWVLRRACADAVDWPSDVRVAVNFSPKQFLLRPDLAGDIEEVLQRSGLPAERLEVEITESTIIEASDALAQLERISACGVKISLDDFGTGYSSLSYLRQFPVDKIKIDRSFAQDVMSKASRAVIGSVSVLAQMLDVELVVEGVETLDQLRALGQWKIQLVQGYIYSRPLPLEELQTLMQVTRPFRTGRKAAA